MSAYELLIDVELNEEAVKCLAISGRQTDAIKSAQEVIEKLEKSNRRDTLQYANMLCILGDVKRDVAMDQKAWDVSHQKCARAMRSLARDHFYKYNY